MNPKMPEAAQLTAERKIVSRLNEWLENAGEGKESPPLVEPIVGEGEVYQLTSCSLGFDDPYYKAVLTYSKGGDLFQCEICTGYDGPGAIEKIGSRVILFASDGEPGRIRRGS